jgi:hypothetical protein
MKSLDYSKAFRPRDADDILPFLIPLQNFQRKSEKYVKGSLKIFQIA